MKKNIDPVVQQWKSQNPIIKKHTLLRLVIVVVIVAVLVVGVNLLQRSLNRPSNTAANTINAEQANYKYKVAVSVTDAGFIPATLTVDKSTQLSFQNNGTVPHSIVADSETAQTEPTLGIKKGDTTPVTLPSGNHSGYYNYTFQNAGTYHVHDGYNPTANLTIIVK